MEYIITNRYKCEEHGFDKCNSAKWTSKKKLKDWSEHMRSEDEKMLSKTFGCQDIDFSYKIELLIGAA